MLANEVHRLKTIFIALPYTCFGVNWPSSVGDFVNVFRRNAVIYNYFTYFNITKISSNAFKIIAMYRTPSINRVSLWGWLFEAESWGNKVIKYSCDLYIVSFFGNNVRRILCLYFHGETEDGEETGFTISYFRNCRADVWCFCKILYAWSCTARIVLQLTLLYKMLRFLDRSTR